MRPRLLEIKGSTRRRSFSPWQRLLAGALALAAIWLAALPMVSRQPAIRAYIERNESLGIDPGAKFYTELPAMRQFIDQVESINRRDAEAFWTPGQSRDRTPQ